MFLIKKSFTFIIFIHFTTSHVEILKNVHDALKVLEWREAINEEMRALEKSKTREVINLPREKNSSQLQVGVYNQV